jgi:threonine/homoserine/homoserine lactone efflux protein
MSLSAYGAFLGVAIILVLVPGPDFAVVTKNTLAGGRRRGRFTAAGVGTSNAVQGAVAVSGLSAIILRAQPVFTAIKWAGACYLAVLGIQSLVSALRGSYDDLQAGEQGATGVGAAMGGWRQGFLSNITNPKVLIFYIAVLPQFLRPGTGPGWLLVFAWSHAALSVAYLMALSTGLAKARSWLARRRVRRAMDAATGAVLLGFSARLAAEHG